MKHLFLTSNSYDVIHDVVKHIPSFRKGMKLVFIPTAAEVETGSLSWLHKDRQSLIDVGFDVTDFSIANKNLDQIKGALDPMDVVFFSGGNTYFLMQEIQRSGCTEYLQNRVENGMIYIGSSAGSIVAGPTVEVVGDLDDRSFAPDLNGNVAMNLVDGTVFPHWGSPHFEKRYEKCMKNGYKKGNKLIILTDDQYLEVIEDMYRIQSI